MLETRARVSPNGGYIYSDLCLTFRMIVEEISDASRPFPRRRFFATRTARHVLRRLIRWGPRAPPK